MFNAWCMLVVTGAEIKRSCPSPCSPARPPRSQRRGTWQLPQRCIGGALAVGDVDFCHVSSGSSGEPTFWARSTLSELTVATRFEQILCDNFRATETPLLCVSVSSGQLGRRNLHHLLPPLLRHQGAQSHYSHPRQRPVRNPALHQSSRPSVSANVHAWLSSLREGAN